MSQPASRLITLIMLLQRQPNQKAGDLAEKLGVSVRTLHRYFAALDEMGIPVYTERGRHGGFSLVRGYKMPPLVFTPQEATAIYLGAKLVDEIWGGVYHEAAEGALAKLDNVLPDEQRQEVAWARRALVATGLHRSDLQALGTTLETLRRAARELRCVSLLYRSSNQTDAQRREVDPYALVHRWGWWYVVGYCHLRQAMRSFRVDRIIDLSLTSQVFQAPTEFDIHAYLATEFQGQPMVLVRMRFVPQAAAIALDNRAFWEAMEQQADEAMVVSFFTPDLEWAASTVLAYGPLVTVLEPEALRLRVNEWATAILALYDSNIDDLPFSSTTAGRASSL
jgi:predicted DNA-binding transcriptional regulator YafY